MGSGSDLAIYLPSTFEVIRPESEEPVDNPFLSVIPNENIGISPSNDRMIGNPSFNHVQEG